MSSNDLTTPIAKPAIKTTFAPGAALPTSTPEKAKTMPTKVASKVVVKPKAVVAPVAKTPSTAVAPAAVQPKPAVKAVAKKVAVKAPAKSKPPKVEKAPKVAKPPKAKKTKMVRDSMTMPKAEYAVIEELKLRAAKLERPVKKTELLRAGIKALAAMADAGFLNALKAVPSLKTGRPNKN